jgi:hypothetical protein
VYGTSNKWTQSSVTYGTEPPPTGAKVASVATAVALNTSYLFDVTPLVSMLLTSPNADGAHYLSKEGSTTQAPQLQVTWVATQHRRASREPDRDRVERDPGRSDLDREPYHRRGRLQGSPEYGRHRARDAAGHASRPQRQVDKGRGDLHLPSDGSRCG